MNFGQQGRVLSWQTLLPLPGGQAAQVLFTTSSELGRPRDGDDQPGRGARWRLAI